ncbi:Carbonic anhydrase precursor [Candidatus Brocadiaceae bacterium B188]|nr:carbonic anhydrase family protein [Candidatus Brocadia sapporoensis]QQR67691.1 MAG: carbonic anhydrase family protein [Candidatus Brocadia sp.]RZV59082.1 MAG: carbonic anhydrase family protein [Candidatus Brocadia sp. BROELEC01]TWU52522.1 Carbonic anhydrase precursor [Candidatus Brocadiaceae bacterium B188]
MLAKQDKQDHASHGINEDKPAGHWRRKKVDYFEFGPEVGERQSPIGISITEKGPLESINFYYYPAPLKIINNGYTIQIKYGSGSYITVGNTRYELMQFHFHHPSELIINGQSYPMEAHLVHKAADGKLAVIGVLMKEDKGNDFIKTLWKHFPKEGENEVVSIGQKIDANQLLPANVIKYYHYSGSLTTPPCSEIVNWFILKTPITISKVQADTFKSIFKKSARPIQPRHGRIVKENN